MAGEVFECFGLRVDRGLKSTPHRFTFVVSDQGTRKEPTGVLIETFIRKQLRLKAHTVTKVEETGECMLVHIDRLGQRLLRCGFAGSDAWKSTTSEKSGNGAICPCGSCH